MQDLCHYNSKRYTLPWFGLWLWHYLVRFTCIDKLQCWIFSKPVLFPCAAPEVDGGQGVRTPTPPGKSQNYMVS